jgi:hypothetical protein
MGVVRDVNEACDQRPAAYHHGGNSCDRTITCDGRAVLYPYDGFGRIVTGIHHLQPAVCSDENPVADFNGPLAADAGGHPDDRIGAKTME